MAKHSVRVPAGIISCERVVCGCILPEPCGSAWPSSLIRRQMNETDPLLVRDIAANGRRPSCAGYVFLLQNAGVFQVFRFGSGYAGAGALASVGLPKGNLGPKELIPTAFAKPKREEPNIGVPRPFLKINKSKSNTKTSEVRSFPGPQKEHNGPLMFASRPQVSQEELPVSCQLHVRCAGSLQMDGKLLFGCS